MKPPKSLTAKTFTLLLIGILAGAPSFMIVSYSGIAPSDDLEKADNQSSDTQYNGPLGLDRPDQQNYAIDKELQADMGVSALADMLGHTTDLGWRVADFKTVKTQFHTDSSEGIELNCKIEGNVLIVTASVCSYSVVTYEFEEGFFDVIHIGNAGLSNVHGEPNLPYRKVLLTIPDGTSVLDIEPRIELSEDITDFAVAPGPVPLEVSRSLPVDTTPWFNPSSYFLDEYTPSELVESSIVGVAGNQGLQLTLHPIQYNPVREDAKFILRMTVEIVFNSPISEEVLRSPAEYNFEYNPGGTYVLVIDEAFASSVVDFAGWKTQLGYDVQVVTTQYILSTYSGYDNPEKLRNFVDDAYQTNGTVYFLFLGDCDVVPAREVYDPAGGSGLDNGTEPSDFYFECLDGNWDSNGNHVYGEMDDTVDLFPEVMVGRIPVQTPAQAEDVLMKIISVESNPESGGWFDDFLLIGPECFTPGDGVGMLEEYLNQKYLVGSFFDTYRLYPTDGSLSHTNTINRLNAGVGIVDFFDHGAYDTWVSALDASEALALANGNKSMFAFCMACETAAFDAESVEPVIGEAFFRGTAGGAHTYIGATRVAWAGDHVFDGFHNRFWAAFMEDALAERAASPKAAFHQALKEMATVFDTDSPYTRETLYHAIYFGDPTLRMIWKHNVSTDATPVEVNEETTLTGECTLFQSGVPLGGYVNVTVRDPLGAIVYDDALLLDGFGAYDTNFYVGDIPGYYKVETRIWDPFPYCEETQFYVGSFDVTVQLDSAPVYNTSISFSGTSNTDGSAIARVTDSGGNVITTEALTVSSGVFSGSVTVDAFGWVNLHVDVDGITANGGAGVAFKIIRGEVLIISDNAGDYGPSYPGGWADYNYGDGVNYGEIREALDPEYDVTEFHTMRNGTPTLSYLQQFDAVAVSVGDNYNAPLIASLSFLLDVLQNYHDSGGHIMFEGGSILNALSASYGSYLASLFHVSFTTNFANSGGLYLANSGHPITSGMPSSVFLQDDLGSDRVDVFSPAAEATHVSSYSGAYSGGSAITAMSATETLGAIVVIGFAVDAIESDALRMKLIQNAVGFLLHPTVMLSLSDYAVPYGISDTIEIQAFEASTGTPIAGVTVEFTGCGIDSDNVTLADGTCSIFINPSSFGEITVDASKPGFLNYSTSIIIYDKPKVSVDTIPDFLEKDATQTLTVITTEFYEGIVLPGCFVNISGCGVSGTGYSNSSGMIDFTVMPNAGGRILLNVTLPGYVNSTSYIGVPITAAIIRSYFTMYPQDSCWDQLMANWDDFGDIPLIIDYESLTMSEITLSDLLTVEADVIVIPYGWDPASTDEINAIMDYVRIGKGLVATSSSVPVSPDILASFMGITEDLAYTSTFDTYTYVDQVDVIHPEHPIMRDLPDPFSTNYGYSFWPASGAWDGSAVNGAVFQALSSVPADIGAVMTYRGLVYCSFMPELVSQRDEMQLLYNSMIWSNYEVPEHDLSVSLECPWRMEPGDTTLVNATVWNQGLNDEVDVTVRLFIDEVEVDSMTVPLLGNGTSDVLTYAWNPTVEGIYNVTAFVEEIPEEEILGNNIADAEVIVRPIKAWILWDLVHNSGTTQDFSYYIADLEYADFVIETLDSGQITPSILSDYQILVCVEPWLSYSTTELDAVEAFVRNGGGLLFTGDGDEAIANSLTGFAGIEFMGGGFGGSTTNIHLHEVTQAVTAVSFSAVDHLEVSSPAIAVVEDPSNIDLIAASEIDLGFVVGISDEAPLMNYLYAEDDNAQLGLNIMNWMASGRPDHDISVRLELPDFVAPGDTVDITATAINRGLNTEAGITLELHIDEVIVDSISIPTIENGTSVDLVYAWNPTVEKLYNITAYSAPLPDDNVTWNNRQTVLVNVVDLHDYWMFDGPCTWYDAKANGVNLGINGDDVYTGLDFPFAFPYYDDIFDRIYISSNGWLSFTNTAPWQYSPVPYPTSDSRFTYALAPFWADLRADSNIYAWVTAERVVIQYDNYYYLSGDLLGTFQVVFHKEGIIEFNYLTMENPYYGTVGLNHGNGFHYNSIPYSDLTGVTNYGLVFYYDFPGHELAVQLEAPDLLEPGMSATLNATTVNLGSENETLVTLSLYIDEVKVAEEVIPELNVSNSYTIQYFWTPPAEASYNVTAYVVPVVNETFTGNNRVTIITRVATTTMISDFEEADQVFLPTGLWHLADESNPYVEAHSPTHSMWYGQDSTGNYDTGYRNFGALISRPYMLGSNIDSLIFWSWYQTEYSGRYYDIKDVYVILPDDSWVLIGYVDGTMNTWREYSFDISAFADTIVRFAFFFDTVNQYANNYRGWFIDDVSVIGSLSPLDHDLEVVLDISGQVTVDQETEISATAINWGMNTEFSISIDLYIDETLVNSSSIGIFEPLEIHQISYRWTPAEVRYYNITARVSIVPGEVLHSNNRDSHLVSASSERVFLIIEPTSGETVNGGLVFIDLEASGPAYLQTVYVYVNSIYLFSIYAGMSEDFFVPIYQNGTNYISLEGYWDDGMWSYANLSINSINVVPIVSPETGDHVDWLFEPLGTLDYTTVNFTFTTPSGPFSWNIELLITEYDASGSIVIQDLDYQSMNILNGFVESGMWAGYNMFWISGVTDSCEIGDVGLFLQWNEILVIQDSGLWNGYETWIMEGNMPTEIVFQAFKENGLMCSFSDPYYNYTLVYSDFMPGPDSTPPVWITSSAAFQFEYGQQIVYQLQATDPSGIGSWDISDNFYFDITSTGVLRSESLVPVGDYSVDVTVADIFGNSDTREFTILVRDTTGPTWNILPADQAIESGADFEYLIGAWDLSGIHHWEINDTARFAVNASGGVCNIVNLADGIYGLRVTVYDIYGNINSAEFTLTVGEAPGPFEIPMELIILGTLGIGILAGLLVLVVVRRRMTPRLSD